MVKSFPLSSSLTQVKEISLPLVGGLVEVTVHLLAIPDFPEIVTSPLAPEILVTVTSPKLSMPAPRETPTPPKDETESAKTVWVVESVPITYLALSSPEIDPPFLNVNV